MWGSVSDKHRSHKHSLITAHHNTKCAYETLNIFVNTDFQFWNVPMRTKANSSMTGPKDTKYTTLNLYTLENSSKLHLWTNSPWTNSPHCWQQSTCRETAKIDLKDYIRYNPQASHCRAWCTTPVPHQFCVMSEDMTAKTATTIIILRK